MSNNAYPWPLNVESPRYLSRRFPEQQVDLDIDFNMPRIDVVTALLANCLLQVGGNVVDAELAWELTVADRLQGLLAITHASIGASTTAVANCNHEECGGSVELELGLSSFAIETPTKIDWLSPDNKSLSCRLPTGNDQRAWQQHQLTQDCTGEVWLANRLIEQIDDYPPSNLSKTWLEPLGIALEAADPLTALSIDTLCPFCGESLCVEIDLELLLIESLRSQQHLQIEQIHRLASRYHWSETDILTMPQWRRQRYLSRLAAEVE
jgi:hypothetical protein